MANFILEKVLKDAIKYTKAEAVRAVSKPDQQKRIESLVSDLCRALERFKAAPMDRAQTYQLRMLVEVDEAKTDGFFRLEDWMTSLPIEIGELVDFGLAESKGVALEKQGNWDDGVTK